MSVRSTAKPRLEVRRPMTVQKPIPDRRKPIGSALKTRLKSRADRMSPCLVPLVRNTGDDLSYGRSAS